VKRLIDITCTACDYTGVDKWLEPGEYPACPQCGAATERVWSGRSSSAVIGDETDQWIEHGICHPDGSPKHYTSKSEIERALKAKGLTRAERHVGLPGSDKNKSTSRWI
jgi:hypothetical protein